MTRRVKLKINRVVSDSSVLVFGPHTTLDLGKVAAYFTAHYEFSLSSSFFLQYFFCQSEREKKIGRVVVRSQVQHPDLNLDHVS